MASDYNQAVMGDIARIVIMTGDPYKARYIAQNHLEDAVQFNAAYGANGYTGTYNGKKISIMSAGVGCSSVGLHSYELFNDFGVEKIIRIGRAKLLNEDETLHYFLIDKAYTNSSFAREFSGLKEKEAQASLDLNAVLQQNSELSLESGCVFSCEAYHHLPGVEIKVPNKCCILKDMETFALFHVAACLKKEAACILISGLAKVDIGDEETREAYDMLVEAILKVVD